MTRKRLEGTPAALPFLALFFCVSLEVGVTRRGNPRAADRAKKKPTKEPLHNKMPWLAGMEHCRGLAADAFRIQQSPFFITGQMQQVHFILTFCRRITRKQPRLTKSFHFFSLSLSLPNTALAGILGTWCERYSRAETLCNCRQKVTRLFVDEITSEQFDHVPSFFPPFSLSNYVGDRMESKFTAYRQMDEG